MKKIVASFLTLSFMVTSMAPAVPVLAKDQVKDIKPMTAAERMIFPDKGKKDIVSELKTLTDQPVTSEQHKQTSDYKIEKVEFEGADDYQIIHLTFADRVKEILSKLEDNEATSIEVNGVNLDEVAKWDITAGGLLHPERIDLSSTKKGIKESIKADQEKPTVEIKWKDGTVSVFGFESSEEPAEIPLEGQGTESQDWTIEDVSVEPSEQADGTKITLKFKEEGDLEALRNKISEAIQKADIRVNDVPFDKEVKPIMFHAPLSYILYVPNHEKIKQGEKPYVHIGWPGGKISTFGEKNVDSDPEKEKEENDEEVPGEGFLLTFEFQSQDTSRAIPQEVKKYLPKKLRKKGYYTLPSLEEHKVIKTKEGTWTFEGWLLFDPSVGMPGNSEQPDLKRYIKQDEKFIGRWSFKAADVAVDKNTLFHNLLDVQYFGYAQNLLDGSEDKSAVIMKISGFNYAEPKYAGLKPGLLDALKQASYTINGVEFSPKELTWTLGHAGLKAFIDNNQKLKAAMENGQPTTLIIKFNDNNKDVYEYKSGNNQTLDIKSQLIDGEYTLEYEVYSLDDKKEKKKDIAASMVEKTMDNKVKLVVIGREKFLYWLNKAESDKLLDFNVSSGKYHKYYAEPDHTKYLYNRKGEDNHDAYIYRMKIDNIEGQHEIAALVKMPGMNRKEDVSGHLGEYKSDAYKKVFVEFTKITSNFDGYSYEGSESEIKDGQDPALINLLHKAGIDKDNNYQISKEELQKVSGELDLSHDPDFGRVRDISMLKDLGPGVEALYLNGNAIKKVPEGLLDRLTKLKKFYIAGNKQLESLPKDLFKYNTELVEVDLGNTGLTSLDQDLFKHNKKLESFSITKSPIKTLPEHLFDHTPILNKFFAYESGLETLPRMLFKNAAELREIRIGQAKLKELPDSLADCHKLLFIDASGNQLTSIPLSLSKARSLIGLKLNDNNIKEVPKEVLLQLVRNSQVANRDRQLASLDLSNNQLSKFPLKEMAELSRKTFTHVRLDRNNLPMDLNEEQIAQLEQIGITFKFDKKDKNKIYVNDNQAYQPQVNVIDAKLTAEAGQLKLSQDLDILETYYWHLGDNNYFKGNESVFNNKEEFREYLLGKGRENNRVVSTDRNQAVVDILKAHRLKEWKISTTITKNNGKKVYEKTSEANAKDGQTFSFNDDSMRTGDQYELVKRLFVGEDPVLTYSVTAKAGSDGIRKDNRITEKVDVDTEQAPQTVKARLWNKTKNSISAGNNFMKPEVTFVVDKDEIIYTVSFQDHVTKFIVDGEMATALPSKDKDYKNVFTFKRPISAEKKQYKKESLPVKFAVDLMSFEATAELELFWNDLPPAKSIKNTEDSKEKDHKKETVKQDGKDKENVKEPIRNKDKETVPVKNESTSKSRVVSNAPVHQSGWSKSFDLKKSQPVEQKKETVKTKSVGHKKGYIGGYPDGSFRPDSKMTRAELASILAQFLPAVTDAKGFSDIEDDAWYASAVKTLQGNHILVGYKDGTFRPDMPISRAEVIALMVRMNHLSGGNKTFKDTKGHWAEKVIAAAADAGIVHGYHDGMMRPNVSMTRAEVVTVINKTFRYKDVQGSPMNFADVLQDHWAAKEIAIASAK